MIDGLELYVPVAWSRHKRELSTKKRQDSFDKQSRLMARFSFFSFSTQVVSLSSMRLRELQSVACGDVAVNVNEIWCFD
jgi:hypothetical protein